MGILLLWLYSALWNVISGVYNECNDGIIFHSIFASVFYVTGNIPHFFEKKLTHDVDQLSFLGFWQRIVQLRP